MNHQLGPGTNRTGTRRRRGAVDMPVLLTVLAIVMALLFTLGWARIEALAGAVVLLATAQLLSGWQNGDGQGG